MTIFVQASSTASLKAKTVSSSTPAWRQASSTKSRSRAMFSTWESWVISRVTVTVGPPAARRVPPRRPPAGPGSPGTLALLMQLFQDQTQLFATMLQVRFARPVVVVGAEVQGRPVGYCDFGRAGPARVRAQRPISPFNAHGNQGRARAQRQPQRAGAQFLQFAGRAAGAFGEHAQDFALLEHGQGRAQGARVLARAIDREGAPLANGIADDRHFEQFLLGHEGHWVGRAQGVADQERVQHAEVVGRDDGGALLRDVLLPQD